ncbi:hypothetical protein AB4K20DRAFT_1966709 [Rhizopus microsporus]
MRPDGLTSPLTEVRSLSLSRYVTVLYVHLCRDPVEVYTSIDTVREDRTILPLGHEINLTNQRLIYVKRNDILTCYNCGDPGRLIRDCSKRNTVDEKYTRYNNSLSATSTVCTRSSTSITTTAAAVVSEEDDDADDPDHVPSNALSIYDESKQYYDAMLIEL